MTYNYQAMTNTKQRHSVKNSKLKANSPTKSETLEEDQICP